MRSAAFLLLSFLSFSSSMSVPLGAQAPADTTVYSVTYAEVAGSSSATLTNAFKQYRDASRKEDGYIRFDLREQMGRPGLFSVVETWRDQKAIDAHAAAAHTKRYQDAIRPIRVAGYDERPYKAFAVAPAREGSGQAVHVVAHVDIAGNAAQAEAPAMLRKLAETSRAEPGCLRFDVLQHMMRANHYTVIEVWQDQKSIDAHRATAHTKEFREVIQPMSGSPLDERWYKGVE
jgi:quinol monooxygenase YgiN